jgi:hypothetical protein
VHEGQDQERGGKGRGEGEGTRCWGGWRVGGRGGGLGRTRPETSNAARTRPCSTTDSTSECISTHAITWGRRRRGQERGWGGVGANNSRTALQQGDRARTWGDARHAQCAGQGPTGGTAAAGGWARAMRGQPMQRRSRLGQQQLQATWAVPRTVGTMGTRALRLSVWQDRFRRHMTPLVTRLATSMCSRRACCTAAPVRIRGTWAVGECRAPRGEQAAKGARTGDGG